MDNLDPKIGASGRRLENPNQSQQPALRISGTTPQATVVPAQQHLPPTVQIGHQQLPTDPTQQGLGTAAGGIYYQEQIAEHFSVGTSGQQPQLLAHSHQMSRSRVIFSCFLDVNFTKLEAPG